MSDPILSQRGGARRGSWNVTWPFERLDVYPRRIVLSGEDIPIEDIEELSRHNGWLSLGLRIHRKSTDEKLIFWTFNFTRLKDALIKAGFEVRD
jgi:hypothetical protein